MVGTVAVSLSSRQMAAALEALREHILSIGLSMRRYDLQYICTNKDFEWEITILEQKYFKENMSIVFLLLGTGKLT